MKVWQHSARKEETTAVQYHKDTTVEARDAGEGPETHSRVQPSPPTQHTQRESPRPSALESTTLPVEDVIFLVSETLKLESLPTSPSECPAKSTLLSRSAVAFVLLVAAALVAMRVFASLALRFFFLPHCAHRAQAFVSSHRG